MQNKIKVMIVDDQNIFTEALSSLLKLNDSLEIIATAENGKIALEKIRFNQPDILILDYEMPVMDGEETTIEVIKQFPKIKIIMLTMHNEAALVKHLLDLGLHSFLPKSCDIEQLLEAIQTVQEKGFYISQQTEKSIERVEETKASITFNKTERQIIRFMVFGKRDREISDILGIPFDTVNRHKDQIRLKTGIKHPAQIGAYAVKHGIVDVRDFRIK